MLFLIIVIKHYILTINTVMRTLCALIVGIESAHCSHFDFLVDWQMRKMNAAIGLTQQTPSNCECNSTSS